MRSYFVQAAPFQDSGLKLSMSNSCKGWNRHIGCKHGQLMLVFHITFTNNDCDKLTRHGNPSFTTSFATAQQSAMKALARTPNPGAKIVFVGSSLSLLSFVGFSTYSPGKFALRGLAETLRSEGLLYGVDVKIFYAPTMRSPGLEVENSTKPAITSKFEEDDEVLESDQAAHVLLKGTNYDCPR